MTNQPESAAKLKEIKRRKSIWGTDFAGFFLNPKSDDELKIAKNI